MRSHWPQPKGLHLTSRRGGIAALAVGALLAGTVPALSGGSSAAAPVIAADAAAAGTVKPTALQVENLESGLGIDTPHPRLSWVNEADYNGAEQSAYEIVVSSTKGTSGDVWSSGKVESSDTFEIRYDGPQLDSKTRYYWAVRVWNEDDQVSNWSDVSFFETAFLDSDEFGGDWIGRTDTRPSAELPEVLLRKDFEIDDDVARARVYIAGLGLHKLYLNGERVGNRELDPSTTRYDKTIHYVTHDVTDELVDGGENAIGVSLGRGYYSRIATTGAWASEPELKLQLDVTYEDGSSDTIVSDETWTTDDGPTTKDAIQYGESYDARLVQPGWNDVDFDDSGWDDAILTTPPTGTLRAMDINPIRVIENLNYKGQTKAPSGGTRYDFGTTFAGWSTIGLSGPAGSVVTIKYGEKYAANGDVDSNGTMQTYTYTLKGGGTEVYTPSYSYNGFRYVQVNAPAGVTVKSLTGQRLSSDFKSTGTFTSSNQLFNRYHQAMVNSQRSNFHSYPTDTPLYEKAGWTGDGGLMVENSLLNFDSANGWEKWLQDHADSQVADGRIPDRLPGTFAANDDPIWSSSYIIVALNLYGETGNTSVLREHYDNLQKWLAYYQNAIEATDYIWTGFTYGDHEAAQGGPDAPANAIYPSRHHAQELGTAFIYEGHQKLAEIARILGHEDDAAGYDAFAARIKEKYNARLFDAESGTYLPDDDDGYRQTDNVMPLVFGMVPDSEIERVCAGLVNDVANTWENHISTGAVGTKHVLPALTACGEGELAFKAATNPTYPGWGHLFQTIHGSTNDYGDTRIVDTHWEAWCWFRARNCVDDPSRSHNHAFRGTIDDWLYRTVAGINRTGVAYRQVEIAPNVLGDLTSAAATIQSPLGSVGSAWKVDDTGRMTLDVQIPVGSTATVRVPVADGQTARAVTGELPESVKDGEAVFALKSGAYKIRTGAAPGKLGSPAVVGSFSVGSTVTCVPGSWTDAESYEFAWAVDGVAVEGADKDTFDIAAAHQGKTITCTVTVLGTSGVSTATSAGVKIPAQPAAGVSASTTTVSLSQSKVRYGKARSAVVSVSVPNGKAAGSVEVFVDGTSVGTATLNASGSATVELPRTSEVGVRAVSAVYAGTAGVASSSGGAALTVTQASSKTKVKLASSSIQAGSSAKATVTVRIPGFGAAVGRVRLTLAGKAVSTKALKSGKARFTINKSHLAKPGSYKVKAAYLGSNNVADSTATARVVVRR